MNINVIVRASDRVKQKIKYGFTLLFQPLRVQLTFTEDVSSTGVNIFYGSEPPSTVTKVFFIKSSPDFETCVASSELPDISETKWIEFAGRRLPVLFPTANGGSASKLNFDIAAATFMLASDFQDLISHERDEYDRMRAMDSLQDKLGVIDFPVVNYYSQLLKKELEEFFGIRIEPKSYGSKNCGLALTHDVDYTSSLNLRMIRRAIFGHAILNKEGLSPNERAVKLIYPLLALVGYNPPKSGLYFLRDLETKSNVKSTFFIKTGATAKQDVKYNYRSGKMKRFLGSLIDYGFEIGIHPSMNTYVDAKQTIKEKVRLEELLGKEVRSVRQHYLKFTIGRTVEVWEEAGLHYDSTLGFSRKAGFRNSVGFPYPLYNFAQDRISSVIELPLMIMDATIAENRRLTADQSFQEMRGLINETKASHGAAAILFHNSIADPIDFPGYKKVYGRLIDDAKHDDFALDSLSGIIENYR